jgi:hypothetical protein
MLKFRGSFVSLIIIIITVNAPIKVRVWAFRSDDPLTQQAVGHALHRTSAFPCYYPSTIAPFHSSTAEVI